MKPKAPSCKTGNIPMKSRSGMGNLPEPMVGDPIPAKPGGLGPSGTRGSFTPGKAPGTRMAK